MWKDNSLRSWTEKEGLAEIVACRVRTNLGIDDEGSTRPYDDGGMDNEGEDHVSKSRREATISQAKARIANVTAKLESY